MAFTAPQWTPVLALSNPPVRTVPVCSVGDTTGAEMKGYGLAALAPLATVYSSV